MTLFVTGTDTGVGKTHTITQLLRLLRSLGLTAAGFKPICCGDRGDAHELLGASTAGLTIDEVNPIWLKTPLAPLPAAELERRKIDIHEILRGLDKLRQRVDLVLVEGVGGWLVPIRSDYLVRDLAVDMQLPVLIVALNRLGCLNHTLLTVQSVLDSGLSCGGVVLNDTGSEDDIAKTTNADVLRRLLSVPVLPLLRDDTGQLPLDWARLLGVQKPV